MPFSFPTLGDLTRTAQDDLNAELGGLNPTLRFSLSKILARVWAGALRLLYLYLDRRISRSLPFSEDSDKLEEWCAEYDIFRKAATPAEITVQLIGTTGTTVPAATQWQTIDGLLYGISAAVVLGPTGAEATMTAIESGSDSNVVLGDLLTTTTNVPGLDSDGTVLSIVVPGFDEETNSALYGRFVEFLAITSTGGNDDDYVRWAKEIAGVTRAWTFPLYTGLGTVGVMIVTDDAPGGPVPTPAKIAEVLAHLADKGPIDLVNITVFAPTLKALNPVISITPDTPEIRAAVEAELTDLLRLEGGSAATIPLSTIDEAISIAPEELSHILEFPTVDFTMASNEIGVPGTFTWVP